MVIDRIITALPPLERSSVLNFMHSHRHGQRELQRLTEQLAGELFIQCLMDRELGLDQDELAQAIGDTRAKIISTAMWATLSASHSALERFWIAYSRRYIEDVLVRLPKATPARQAA